MVPERQKPRMDVKIPEVLATATFALGCFWDPDSRFGIVSEVIRTRVGYAGGTTKNPTYYSLGDHTETIQVDYDPARISYRDMLDVFWASHRPLTPPYSPQYKSIIFYHDDEQRHLALETKRQEEESLGKPLHTEVRPFAVFYVAEDYHQKYKLHQEPELLLEYRAIYPQFKDFVDSTAVARVNGYVSGYGSLEALRLEIDDLGLTPKGQKKLTEVVGRKYK